MKRKEILLIRNVDPDAYGGGEVYQLQLAKELKEYNISPIIVTSSKKLLVEAEKHNVSAIEAPYNKRQNWSGKKIILMPLYWRWQRRLRKWYKQLFLEHTGATIDVQSRDDWIAATVAAKRLQLKVIWTDHADFRNWVLNNVDIWYKNFIAKKVLKCAKYAYKIIFVSNYDYSYFRSLKSTKHIENTTVLYNGVKDAFKKMPAAKQKLYYIGRIEASKGINELLEAFVRVKKRFKNITLDLYGDDSKFRQPTKIDGVTFHGQVDDNINAVSDYDIFVLPSYMEGLSLSMLEASMMGKAIIATGVGGTPEVIKNGKNGILIRPKNVDELEQAILKLVTNQKLCKEYGTAARQIYQEKFDLKKIIKDQFLPLLDD